MPIVYVHGVSVRQDPPYPPQTEIYLRQLIAPVLAPDDPAGVAIIRANWFADGVKLAWNGRSIPEVRSAVLGEAGPPVASAPEQTAPERAITVTELGPALADIQSGPGGRLLGGDGPPPAPRLSDFSEDELSNFLAAVLESGAESPDPDQARQRAGDDAGELGVELVSGGQPRDRSEHIGFQRLPVHDPALELEQLPLVAVARRERQHRRPPVAEDRDTHLVAEPRGMPAVMFDVHRGDSIRAGATW